MSSQRLAQASLPPEALDAFDAQRARVLSLATEVLQTSGPEEGASAADRLTDALWRMVGKFPGDKLQPLVRALLDDPRVGGRLDGAGRPLRASFVAVQQELGYPWALEVTPEDLELLKNRVLVPARGDELRRLTFYVAGGALCWNALVAIFCVLAAEDALVSLLPAGFLAAGFAHAVMAMAATPRSRPESPRALQKLRERLRDLARAGVLAPLGAALVSAAVGDPNLGILKAGLFIAAPSMLVAALCGLVALRLAPTAPTAPSADPPAPP